MMLVFPWITSLDFDDCPTISHCSIQSPYGLERFPTFVAFVNSVLQAHQSPLLAKFRLVVGPNRWNTRDTNPICHDFGEIDCFPDLKSTQINAWVALPLTRPGLRELDLCIHVMENGGVVQLPLEIFTCRTLEVLKLDVNLGLDQVSAMQSFGLPNLKELAILTILFPADGLVTRLVSSCPLLEDFTLKTRWHHAARFISIASSSLRRFSYAVWSNQTRVSARDSVLIHAPNLEYLLYADDLASEYSIASVDCLIKAVISIHGIAVERVFEASGQIILGLIQFFSNVQHLVLEGECAEELSYDEVKDHLPVFPKLKCLEPCYFGEGSFDRVLSAFLNCSPLLETLIFQGGLKILVTQILSTLISKTCLNPRFSITDLPDIPSCCRYHLKRIEIKGYKGDMGDIDLIQYFLRCALVL